MPLVDVSYDASVPEPVLRRLAEALPDIVAEAVDCTEEPWTGPPGPGDIEIRFRRRDALDVGELACVIEVRTKALPSRRVDPDARAALVLERLGQQVPDLHGVGVWLVLLEGAWVQDV